MVNPATMDETIGQNDSLSDMLTILFKTKKVRLSRVDQECKYNIKNMKDCLCNFVFLILTKSMLETRFNQNCSLMLNWSDTKSFLKWKEQPEATIVYE